VYKLKIKMNEQKKLSNIAKTGSIKHMKQTSKEMEKDNIAIELKIKTLKEKMTKEKEERERMGGPRWQSSAKSSQQRTPSTKQSKRVLKVLTDQPLDKYYQQKAHGSGHDKTMVCGQCENRSAKVSCNECTELYCSVCYKQFHSKGALRKHTWKSVERKDKDAINHESNQIARGVDNKWTVSKNVENIQVNGNNRNNSSMIDDSLLDRQYDEEANAVSFAEALNEWRKNKNENTIVIPTSRSDAQNDGRFGQMDSRVTNNDRSGPQNDRLGRENRNLFEGSYNEEKNAEEFSQALSEWRNSGNSKEGIAVSTDPMKTGNPGFQVNVNIATASSLTYLDRITVKRLKQNPNLKNPTPTFKPSNEKHHNSSTNQESDLKKSSVNNKSLSPCILSLHVSQPYQNISELDQQSSLDIDIYPYEEGESYEDDEKEAVIPIISSGESDTEDNPTSHSTRRASIVQMEFKSDDVKNTDLNNKQNLKIENKSEYKRPSICKIPQDHANKNFSPVQESPDVRLWSPLPKYNGIDKFFLIGATPNSETTLDDKSLDNQQELNCVEETTRRSSYSSGKEWNPMSSYRHDVDPINLLQPSTGGRRNSAVEKVKNFRDVSRKHSHELPKLNIDSYDYIQAPPPLIKGDNYNKLHRASTSLSISALPFDVWQDHDLPSSRRSSHLALNMMQFSPRFSDTKKESVRGKTDYVVNFDAIDDLAREITAHQQHKEEAK